MNRENKIKILYESGKTIFTLQNLANLWNMEINSAKVVAKRMVDRNVLYRIAKGYYSLSEDYNPYELANLIIQPSYVSLQTALFYHKISFQVSKIITSVARISYSKKIGEYIFKYFSQKEEIFFNVEGIDCKNNIAIATPERAILDSFYFGYLPNIDNLEKINIAYLKKLSLIYPKSVRKKIKGILK